jgi:hypothetical protein
MAGGVSTVLAEILKGERQPVANMVMDRIGNEHATGLGKGFKSRRDVHPIAEYVFALGDHITEVDPDPELDPLLRRGARIALGHPPLHLDRAAHGIHDTRKFCQKAVAGILHDPAPVLGDFRPDQLPKVRPQPFVRPLLIRAHQPRVARHIGGEDRGEAADRRHFLPGGQLS